MVSTLLGTEVCALRITYILHFLLSFYLPFNPNARQNKEVRVHCCEGRVFQNVCAAPNDCLAPFADGIRC